MGRSGENEPLLIFFLELEIKGKTSFIFLGIGRCRSRLVLSTDDTWQWLKKVAQNVFRECFIVRLSVSKSNGVSPPRTTAALMYFLADVDPSSLKTHNTTFIIPRCYLVLDRPLPQYDCKTLIPGDRSRTCGAVRTCAAQAVHCLSNGRADLVCKFQMYKTPTPG
ncbi:unnamed protein product [Amoebophrya sp. A120]|nr:unnamed protein product [Amoebophrya sp. A120]|eukprot:GSA120T00012537001.1